MSSNEGASRARVSTAEIGASCSSKPVVLVLAAPAMALPLLDLPETSVVKPLASVAVITPSRLLLLLPVLLVARPHTRLKAAPKLPTMKLSLL